MLKRNLGPIRYLFVDIPHTTEIVMGPDLLIPLGGMVTGIIGIAAMSWAGVRIFNGPVGQALARRIQGHHAGADPDVMNELLELRHQVEQMQQRLGDTEERLDFSERLLAQRSEATAGGSK